MLQNIETSTGLGVPDIFYGYNGIQGWIELKEVNREVKTKTKIPWRAGQLAWYHDYKRKVNGNYFLFLTIQDDWYIIDYIKEEYTIYELMECSISKTRFLSKHKAYIKKLLAYSSI